MRESAHSPAGTPSEANQPPAGTPAPSPEGGSPEPTQTPQKSKHQRLLELLKDEEPPGESGNPKPPGGGKGKAGGSQDAKPKKFNELAERIGVELSELYALEIAEPGKDGKPVTVETLKDHYAKRAEFSVREIEWEEERSRQQAELVRNNAELRELISALPRDAIKPEVLQKVKAKHDAVIKRERQDLLRVVPEWKDENTETKERGEMAEWLKDFGFPSSYLETVIDHRALHFIRENWRRYVRLTKALEELEEKPDTMQPGKHKGGKPPRKPDGRDKPNARGRAGLMVLLEE